MHLLATPRLILASASPRRQHLLEEAGYAFDIHPANVDESDVPLDLSPSELARHLAIKKAEALTQEYPDCVILAADTIVSFGEMVLGKPRDIDHAREMISLLSGTTHLVITGVALRHLETGHKSDLRVISAVRMRMLSVRQIDQYLATGDWRGKAGGYGIQDADPFVTRLSGSQSNIVGLPMADTRRLLAEAGIRAIRPSSTTPQ